MWEAGRTLWGPGTSEPGQCLGQEGGCGGRGSTQMGLAAPQFDRVAQHSC